MYFSAYRRWHKGADHTRSPHHGSAATICLCWSPVPEAASVHHRERCQGRPRSDPDVVRKALLTGEPSRRTGFNKCPQNFSTTTFPLNPVREIGSPACAIERVLYNCGSCYSSLTR